MQITNKRPSKSIERNLVVRHEKIREQTNINFEFKACDEKMIMHVAGFKFRVR